MVILNRYPTLDLKTYNFNIKPIIKLFRIKISILVFALTYIYIKQQNDNVEITHLILIKSGIFAIFFTSIPDFILVINYYFENRKTSFSINEFEEEIEIIKNGVKTKYNFNDIKRSVYNRCKNHQDKFDNGFRLAMTFSDFGYWDLTFKNGDRYYLTNLLHDVISEPKIPNTEFRFRGLPIIDKNNPKKKYEVKIEEYDELKVMKENFQNMNIEKLQKIIENKTEYRKEAIEYVEKLLREKNVG